MGTNKQVGSIIQWYESLDKYPVTVAVDIKAATAPGSGSAWSSDKTGFGGGDIKDRAV